MLRAGLDVEPVSRHSVAVTAATAASAIVVHAQLDATERAFTLDDEHDGLFCLVAERRVHAVMASLQVSRPLAG
jgi:hypothetical protein